MWMLGGEEKRKEGKGLEWIVYKNDAGWNSLLYIYCPPPHNKTIYIYIFGIPRSPRLFNPPLLLLLLLVLKNSPPHPA